MTLIKTLTASERFLLNEIDSVPGKIVRRNTLRQSARHLTIAGFTRVLRNMEKRSLVKITPAGEVTITFSGMKSLEG